MFLIPRLCKKEQDAFVKKLTVLKNIASAIRWEGSVEVNASVSIVRILINNFIFNEIILNP